jgi:hypothetical protein
MKTLATVALLVGVSILHARSASADIISNVQCNTEIQFENFYDVPRSCPTGGSYDAGNVSLYRRCSYDATDSNNQTQTLSCSASWTESYFHALVNEPDQSCGDGGFVEQIDSNITSNCPF